MNEEQGSERPERLPLDRVSNQGMVPNSGCLMAMVTGVCLALIAAALINAGIEYRSLDFLIIMGLAIAVAFSAAVPTIGGK